MEYKFFTKEEVNYITEMYMGTNTIKKNNFEEKFYTLHYDELIDGRMCMLWMENAEMNKNISENELLKVKVESLNYGIGHLNRSVNNELERGIDTLKDVIDYWYKEDNNYIRLLSYILLSENSNRVTDIETLNLLIDDLCIILKTEKLKEHYNTNFNYKENNLKEEIRKKESEESLDEIMKMILKRRKKYKFSAKDIFSDILEKQIEEGIRIPLSNQKQTDIFDIWRTSIIGGEDFYYIVNAIKRYCEDEKIDYIMALYSIYIKNQIHYYCRYGNLKSNYDLNLQEDYFNGIILTNFIYKRISDIYNGDIKDTDKIEDNIANMFNTLDDNTDNNNRSFDKTTANEQGFTAFLNIRIDVIRKYNNYTANLEKIISEGIKVETKEVVSKKEKNKRDALLPKFDEERLTSIFETLVENNYISCELDLFLSCLGFREEKEGFIIWKSTNTDFEIFISKIIKKEKNPINNNDNMPRKKINKWFLNKNNEEIKPATKISCDIKTYKIYKIIQP